MTEEQILLSDAALTAFRLNGQFLSLGDELANPAGLTVTQWQVLGATLNQPLTHAEIGRQMGITRQSVHRTAKILVANGLAEYEANPAHRKAPLFGPTLAGRQAVSGIGPQHAATARRLVEIIGLKDLEATVSSLRKLSAALEQLGT